MYCFHVCSPGTGFNYTTHGFTLLSAVLEGATNKKFTVLLEDLLKDLGLSNTYIEDREKIRYNLARYARVMQHLSDELNWFSSHFQFLFVA